MKTDNKTQFDLIVGDMIEASTYGKREEAMKEILIYANQYRQDLKDEESLYIEEVVRIPILRMGKERK